MSTEDPEYDLAELKSRLYWDVPSDIGPVRQLLEQYSGVPAENVEEHILVVREKLWNIKPFGCIGKFRFLRLDFTSDPRYQDALARLKAPGSTDTFLDMACCIGQVLRQLALDGVDPSRLYGADLEQGFIDAGYEMFRDEDKLKATFIVGDVLKEGGDERLNVLDGRINILHTASFFHLFTWDDQVKAAKRIIRFLKPEDPKAVIFGRQVGNEDPGTQKGPRGQTRYLHNGESWQRLWDEVGAQTGTAWRTEVDVIPGSRGDVTKIVDGNFNPDGVHRIRFGVYRE
ncbi:hypothetical protein BJ170DRAFT_683243 [Xylariales sp. AK1849]|nr:hypothetical protein BJ170DRAFT_683243 [Xylariales sp. AK1849]